MLAKARVSASASCVCWLSATRPGMLLPSRGAGLGENEYEYGDKLARLRLVLEAVAVIMRNVVDCAVVESLADNVVLVD